jgi:hypothetical protein
MNPYQLIAQKNWQSQANRVDQVLGTGHQSSGQRSQSTVSEMISIGTFRVISALEQGLGRVRSSQQK